VNALGAARLATLIGGAAGEGSDGPAYRRLADAVRVMVGDGRVPAGARLPAERALAEALACSRATVTRAYAELRAAGWARARQGSGTFTEFPSGTRRATGAWVPGPGGDGTIDLAHAAAEAVPHLADAVATAAAALPREAAGHGYDPSGLADLRARIAERFTHRGLPTTPEQIVITHGALHAIATTVATVLGPGDRALVEQPSYPAALDALVDAGARPVGVAVDGGERSTDLLRAARQTAPRLAYLIPDFHNPTGTVISDDQRARLGPRLARLGVTTIVDETFSELALEDAALPAPYAAHAPPAATVTVGSMSKLVWGGLRLGWARATPELAAALRRRLSRAELAPPVLEQLVGIALLDVVEDVRAHRRATLRGRRDTAVACLRERFGHWRVPVAAGGIALWCDLGAPISSALTARAADLGLHLAAGPRFGLGHAFDDHLRIPFTLPEDTLRDAVDRLARAARDLPAAGAGSADTGRLVV
jgi:DNA-binding transcriptional MocR family regulator